jgi:hypothetical protein
MVTSFLHRSHVAAQGLQSFTNFGGRTCGAWLGSTVHCLLLPRAASFLIVCHESVFLAVEFICVAFGGDGRRLG